MKTVFMTDLIVSNGEKEHLTPGPKLKTRINQINKQPNNPKNEINAVKFEETNLSKERRTSKIETDS